MPSDVRRLRRRIIHEYRSAWTRQLRSPSFTYKSLEMQRVRTRMRELGTKDPAYLINDKDDAHQWARELGLRAPRLYALLPSIDSVDWPGLPDDVVLKPRRGTSGRGVHLLRREGTRWRELVSQRLLSPEDIIAGYRLLEGGGGVSREVLLEELVADPRCPDAPSPDYKVMTFYGAVGLIEVKRRPRDAPHDASWKVFDPDWHSLQNPFNDYQTDESIRPPVHADAVLELASRISTAVPRPYLRVDLYEDATGPLLGEVTPEPGGHLDVRPDVDAHLGELWEQAEARLRVRLARGGVLTPDGLAPEPSDLDPRT